MSNNQKQKSRHHHHQKHHGKKTKSKSKTTTPFFPTCPTEVGSPKDVGMHFYPRQIRQRTPKKLCSLVLPPPLISLFDGSSSGNAGTASGMAETAAARHSTSDNASVDGHSIMDASHHSTPIRHSGNASISASVASVGGAATNAGGTPHHSNNVPLHLRVGIAPCDPLLVFNGRFVLVGTGDGRIAIYSIMEFDRSTMSEDVEASERRRREEWEEEDKLMERHTDIMEEEEKKDELKENNLPNQNVNSNDSGGASDSEGEEEEEEELNELELRERMLRRERARERVEPILIVTLPTNNHVVDGENHDKVNKSGSATLEEEESPAHSGTIFNPPTIVAMCATPIGTSLIEKRRKVQPLNLVGMEGNDSETNVEHAKSIGPTFGDDLLGHVAVLTSDGEVHVLEFLCPCALDTDLPGSREDFSQRFLKKQPHGSKGTDATASKSSFLSELGVEARMVSNGNSKVVEANIIPMVNVVLSFRTGFLGATCICMRPIVSTLTQQQNDEDNGNDEKFKQRLCIGHESGILTDFQIYSTCVISSIRKCRSIPKDAERTPKRAIYHPIRNQPTANDSLVDNGGENMTSQNDDISDIPSNHSAIASKIVPFSSTNARSKSNEFHGRTVPRTISTGLTPDEDVPCAPIRRTFSEPISPDARSFCAEGKNETVLLVQPAHAEISWRGSMDVPVCSLSCPGWGRRSCLNKNNDKNCTSDEGKQCEYSSPTSLLVVGLVQRQSESGIFHDAMNRLNPGPTSSGVSNPHLSPAISIDVIDSTLVETTWCQMKDNLEPNGDTCIGDDLVPLKDFSIWPIAGKEIKDGWTRDPVRKDLRRDSLFGMKGLQRLSVTDRLCCFEGPDSCFASAGSDGTVAISHCNNGSWGIAQDDNQIMLCQKCIGLGTLDFNMDTLHSRYVACCLRGGTVYLVPVITPNKKMATPRNHIIMFATPMDSMGEDDGVVRCVQSFTAGIAQVMRWKESSDVTAFTSLGGMPECAQKSVAIMGWPGGNVDIYEITPDFS